MRRPLGGLPAWLVQRLSAIFMLIFTLFVLVHFLVEPPHSYDAWRGWVGHIGVSAASGVFIAALLAHAWVGLRDVTLDYVAPLAARVAVLSLIAATLVGLAAFAFRILFLAHG